MKKPYSLKQHLLTRTPKLKIDPDKFAFYIENGRIRATGVAPTRTSRPNGAGSVPVGTARTNKSFLYEYRAVITMIEFAGEPAHVVASILEWLETNQPDMVDNPTFQTQGITFEVEVLNDSLVDLTIIIDKLTERVVLEEVDLSKPLINGRYKFDWPAEPRRDALLNLDELAGFTGNPTKE